jgi:glycosyltransferase involved in cell wall biosynthesis
MKILQVPFHYYPDVVGGTEVYTASLTRELLRLGVEVEIAAPGAAEEQYVHDGVPVNRFAPRPEVEDLSELYGIGDPVAAEQFRRILDRTQPDLVHLHAMSPAVSLLVVRELKRRDLPVVFTYHIPGITCPRGTLLRYSRSVCDGVWGLHKCSRCVLHSHGLVRPLSQILGSLPPAVGRATRSLGWQGRAATALRTTELQALRQRTLAAFLAEVDQIVAVAGWVRDLLVRNGVPDAKITICRHGRTQADGASSRPGQGTGQHEPGPLRLAFIGRLYPAKGLHVLVDALLQLPALPVKLDVYGVVQERNSKMYRAKLAKRAAGDSRIAFLPALPQEDIVARLAEYDALAVPSQVVETGPLVVYDAFAAGIPVVGARRGGIAELVEHEVNGLLVEAASPNAWGAALHRLADDTGLLERFRAGVKRPRTMAAVAVEMRELYGSVLDSVAVTDGCASSNVLA